LVQGPGGLASIAEGVEKKGSEELSPGKGAATRRDSAEG
jgi:hypothetical protein